jgi:hypothetical protein
MTTMIRFSTNFYAVNGGGTSYIKYQAGATYPVDEETSRLAASGIAETVEIDDPDTPQATSAPVEEAGSA